MHFYIIDHNVFRTQDLSKDPQDSAEASQHGSRQPPRAFQKQDKFLDRLLRKTGPQNGFKSCPKHCKNIVQTMIHEK